jgi:hypothetical protein
VKQWIIINIRWLQYVYNKKLNNNRVIKNRLDNYQGILDEKKQNLASSFG